MFGAHLSVAGGLVNALVEARELRMDCVQVFTRNQRQWKATPIRDDERAAWLDALSEMGWRRGRRTVSHGSYLVNLASPDRAVWRRSATHHRHELERCETLGIRLCVIHPGAHLGEANHQPPRGRPNADERAGLRRVARALDRVHRELPGLRVQTCLETTAGAGTTLGYDFHHLAAIRDGVLEPDRVAFCFDTCHVTAAGYDMTTDAAARAVLREFNTVCGRGQVGVFHLNDSLGEVGSRRDRHTHIGRGACGLSCFRAIVNRRSWARVPKIIETPKGENDKGVPWDVANIRRLKRLSR